MATTSGSDPEVISLALFTADTADPDWYYRKDVADWLREQSVDPDITYRYEIYLIDTLFMKVYQHIRGDDGGILFDRESGELHRQITTIPINDYPPTMSTTECSRDN